MFTEKRLQGGEVHDGKCITLEGGAFLKKLTGMLSYRREGKERDHFLRRIWRNPRAYPSGEKTGKGDWIF